MQTINLPRHPVTRARLDYIYTLQFVEVVSTVEWQNNTVMRVCAAIVGDTGSACNEHQVYYELAIVNGVLPQSAHVP